MNATRTTLRDVLWRWRRGIARAMLLLAALAGMTLGAVAHAQVAFEAASFYAPPAPVFRAAAQAGVVPGITFVGEARMPTTADTGAIAINATITPPGGMAANDFVVVYVAVRDAGTAVTITNGITGGQTWTAPVVTQRQNNVNFRIFHANFTGTWAANPRFDWVTSLPHQVWMVVFRGVHTTTPIDAGPSIAAFTAPLTPFDVTIAATTITTATANAMVIASWHSLDDNTWALQTAGWSNPGGQTHWRTTAGSDSSSSIGYTTQATAGGNGAVTNRQTANGGDAGIFSILALRPSLAPPLTIAKPTGTVLNDVMIASFGFRTNQPGLSTDIAITPPAGWTLVRRLDNPGTPNTDSGLVVYRKVAGASEPASYQWAFSCTLTCATNGFQAAAGGIVTFSGVNTTTPIDVEAGRNTTATLGDQTTPSVTTTVPNTMLVTSHSYATAGPWTPPTGMTEAVDVLAGNLSTEMSYVPQAALGLTGTKQATPAPEDDAGNAHILALRPALVFPLVSSVTYALTTAGTDRVLIVSVGLGINDCGGTTVPTVSGVTYFGVALTRITSIVGTPCGANTTRSEQWRLIDPATGTNNVVVTLSAATVSGQTIHSGAMAFSGVDQTTPVRAFAAASGTGTSSTVTVTSAVGDMVVNTVGQGNIITAPGGGQTQRFLNNVSNSTTINNSAGSTAPGAASSVAMTWTFGSTPVDEWQTISSSLQPPSAVAAGGFNAYETSTAAGAITGFIKTKIAGASVSLHMIALNAAKTAIATTFTGTVRVEVLNASDNSGALDGNNCRPSWTVIQTLSPDPEFIAADNGRKTISFTQANSFPNARLRITFPVTTPTVTGCSTDNFAIRPNTFASYSVTDNSATTAGTGRTLNNVSVPGGLVHYAGRPFTVQATAVNTAPATTTNYTGTPTATMTVCAGTACTATFGTFTLGASFAAGVLTSNVATYSEAGSFFLQLVDSTFSNVDASDGSTTTERNITSAVINVGRFTPNHFAVTLTGTPVFGTGGGCGSFTYIGQTFNYTTAPAITVTAQNFANGTTANYAGALWQITNASLTGKAYTAAIGTLDTSGLTGTDPEILSAGSGMGTLTFRTPSFFVPGTGFFFTRATPVAPFNADISLAINVIDADGVAYATNPWSFGTASAGNGIAFSGGKDMRFGRFAIRNANGSQLVPLPGQSEAQYWLGAPTNAFVTNTADSCTSIAAGNVAMSNFTNNLSGSPTCETALSGGGALSAGRRTLQLAAPGSGNNGSVDLTVNLGASASGTTCTTVGAAPVSATTANRPYLRGNWTGGASYDQNPSARATFGVFKGAEEVIFIRENF